MLTSDFIFIIMILVWCRLIPLLWGPTTKVAHFGIPMILYDPVASFIGGIVLMILISAFLQFLTTLFAVNLNVILAND